MKNIHMKVVVAEVGAYRFVNWCYGKRYDELLPDYNTFALPGGATISKVDLEKWALSNKLSVRYGSF